MNKEKLILLVLFIFAFSLRLFILFSSDNFWGALPAHYILESREIAISPLRSYIFHDIWVYPYLSILATGSLLWNNSFLTPRIISLIFGSFLVFPFYYFVKYNFATREAVISTLLLCLYPLHVILSTVSIKEIPFIFFLFLSLALFFRFIYGEKRKFFFLFASAIFLSFSTMFRLEAVVFIAVLSFWLIKYTSKRKIIFFIFLSFLFILFASVLSFYKYRVFCIYAEITKAVVKGEIMFAREHIISNLNFPLTVIDKILAWPRLLIQTFNPIVVLVSVWGIIKALLNRRNQRALCLFLSIYLFFNYLTIRGLMIVNGQYSLLLCLFLLPFFSKGLENILNSIFAVFSRPSTLLLNKIKFGLYALVICGIFITCINKSFIMRPLIPQGIKDATTWVTENIKPEEKIIIDRDMWQLYFNHIVLYGRLKSNQYINIPFYISQAGKRIVDRQLLRDYIEEEKPKFVLYFRTGVLSENLVKNQKEDIPLEFLEYKIKPLYLYQDKDDENKDYIFYQIIYE